MAQPIDTVPIDDVAISTAIERHLHADAGRVRDVLARAGALQGLEAEDVAALMSVSDPELLDELFDTAQHVKQAIYGRRLVVFAPLYVSNLCGNECIYCAFRARNTELERRALTQEEIAGETRMLIDQGHKRVLLVAGESYPNAKASGYVLKAIETIYAHPSGNGEIRRVNVNVAPLTLDEFRELQGGQDRHLPALPGDLSPRDLRQPSTSRGKKSDYDWRVTAMDRAMEAGIDDVGIGVLFGLFDWKYEMLAIHTAHQAPGGDASGSARTPSACRAWSRPVGSDVASHPPHAGVGRRLPEDRGHPAAGGALHRHHHVHARSADIRRETFALGVSQISAGSRAIRAGMPTGERENAEPVLLGDHRSLDEVIRDVAALGYIPSFCTACYRLGRTGADFMDLAKPGDIKQHCEPNALATFRRVPHRLRVRGDSRRGRAAGGARAGVDGTGSQADGRQHGDARPGREAGRVLLTLAEDGARPLECYFPSVPVWARGLTLATRRS